MEGDTGPLCHGILQRARILHTLRGVQDLDPDNITVLVIVEDDSGFILITFLNRSTTQLNGEHVHFLVVFYLYGFLQYLAILLVR
jgi:hypothetical protein